MRRSAVGRVRDSGLESLEKCEENGSGLGVIEGVGTEG